MNRLLTFAVTVEAATGLALVAVPAAVVRLLLGDEISGAAVSLGRVAGFGLLSLGLACWPRRGATDANAILAILTYNVLTTLYLLWLGIAGERVGLLLWPAVALHGILSVLIARQSRLENDTS